MAKILLEIVNKYASVYLDTDDFDTEILSNGKTLKQCIQDDIISGKDSTGNAKYRKILKENGIISDTELSTWRSKVSIEEIEPVSITP